jgi:hypothetical protein
MYKRVKFCTADKETSERIRAKLEEAEKIIMEIPACRNRSLALTHLEDAMLRANLAVAEGVSLRGEG